MPNKNVSLEDGQASPGKPFQTEETLRSWTVFEVTSIGSNEKSQHAVGRVQGRNVVTSAIQSFDQKTMSVRTLSDRVFHLKGAPGLLFETARHWGHWAEMNEVKGTAADVRNQYLLRPSEALAAHRKTIRQLIQDHHGQNPRVFSSALHGTDRHDDDLTILLDSDRDIGNLRDELEDLICVPVHLLIPSDLRSYFSVEECEKALTEAQPI